MLNTAILEAFAAALGVLITIAAVYGSFRASRSTQSAMVMRDTAQAWEGKSKVQDVEIADLRASVQEKDQKIASLEARNSVLQDVVTGKSLLEQLEARTAELARVLAGVSSNLADMSTVMGDVREMLVAMSGGHP